jgi:hypothetical protein
MGPIDEDTQTLRADPLHHEHFDVGLCLHDSCLDHFLQIRHRSPSPSEEKGGHPPTFLVRVARGEERYEKLPSV